MEMQCMPSNETSAGKNERGSESKSESQKGRWSDHPYFGKNQVMFHFHCYCDIATKQVCNIRATFKLSIHVTCKLQNIRIVLI